MLPYLKFHHIGIAVYDINQTSKYYVCAGYTRTETITDNIQNIKISFLSKKDMPLLELLEPVDERSPVCSVLSKNGVSPYHVCYSVQDINRAIADLKKMRFVPLSYPVEAVAMNMNKICFLYNKDIGLIELVEEKDL